MNTNTKPKRPTARGEITTILTDEGPVTFTGPVKTDLPPAEPDWDAENGRWVDDRDDDGIMPVLFWVVAAAMCALLIGLVLTWQ